jgi:hypothetical protein
MCKYKGIYEVNYNRELKNTKLNILQRWDLSYQESFSH